MSSVVKGPRSSDSVSRRNAPAAHESPVQPPEAVDVDAASEAESGEEKPVNISELHEKHTLPRVCHVCTRSFLLPFPWGNPVFFLIAVAVLIAGGFAIWQGYARAADNLHKPATRSGTFRIGDTDSVQKVFPAFSVIVCPLDVKSSISVILPTVEQVSKFVGENEAAREVAAKVPAAASANVTSITHGNKDAQVRRAAAAQVPHEVRRRAEVEHAERRRSLLQTIPPPPPLPPPPPPPPPSPPAWDDLGNVDSSAYAYMFADSMSATDYFSNLTAFCSDMYYSGGSVYPYMLLQLRVFGTAANKYSVPDAAAQAAWDAQEQANALLGSNYVSLGGWSPQQADAFAADVTTLLEPVLGPDTAAAVYAVYVPYLDYVSYESMPTSVDVWLAVSMDAQYAPLVKKAYTDLLPELLRGMPHMQNPTAASPLLVTLMQGPYFPGDWLVTMDAPPAPPPPASPPSTQSDFWNFYYTSTTTTSSSFTDVYGLYSYYCNGASVTFFTPASYTGSSTDWQNAYYRYYNYTTSDSTTGVAFFSTDVTSSSSTDSTTQQDNAPAMEQSMAPWVVTTLTFSYAASSIDNTTIKAAALALLLANTDSAATKLLNLSASSDAAALATSAAKALRGVIGSVEVTPVPVPTAAAGRRMLAATAAKTAFNVSVATTVEMGADEVKRVLKKITDVQGMQQLLPALPGLRGVTAIGAPRGFMTSVDRQGSVLFDDMYADVLPLFGFITDVSPCTTVKLRTAQFDPSQDVFVHPILNRTNLTMLAEYVDQVDISGQANIQVTLDYGKEVLVGIYERVGGLQSLGDFIILKDDTAGLVNYPTLKAELHKKLKPYTGSLEQVVALTKSAATKKASKAVYDFDWKLSLTAGDAFSQPNVSSTKQGKKSTFIINLQPYFVDFEVHFTEEYYAYGFSDAVANMFVYINTVSLALQVLTPVSFILLFVGLRGMYRAARTCDKEQFLEHAKELARTHSKGFKAVSKLKKSALRSEEDEEEEEEEEEEEDDEKEEKKSSKKKVKKAAAAGDKSKAAPAPAPTPADKRHHAPGEPAP